MSATAFLHGVRRLAAFPTKLQLDAGALAFTFVFISATAVSAATVLTDGDFSGTIDIASHAGSPTATVTGTVCSNCGNPLPGTGNALQATAVYPAGAASSVSIVGFVDHSLSYDPSTQGAIVTINGSYDRLLTSTPFSIAAGFSFRLVLEQSGTDFVTNITVSGASDTGGVWHNLSFSGLTASDFAAINFLTGVFNPTSHPNFAGGPMLFGVEAAIAAIAGQTFNAFFDNIDVTVNNITVNPVPLPTALPLFASGLGALGLLGWRRKRKTAV